MKLQKFDKNRKKKAYIIGGIAFVFAAIIGIVLYRSYALYQEKKSFDVLNGTIPDFSGGDIELAIKVDGQPASNVPTKGNYNVTVDCGDTATGVWDNDKWGASITEIKSSKVKCSVDFRQQVLADIAKVGDYISMTPTSTSYTIPASETGCTDSSHCGVTDQTINPSELNLWRVISHNEDGTVDVVSEYASSTRIFFSGQTGYLNFVGVLNKIARQYENDAYTVKSASRHIGYNGQTEYITDTSKFIYPAPWTTRTDSGHGNQYESQGGGDILYEKDVKLVEKAIGTLLTNEVGTTTETAYWIASRNYGYHESEYYEWSARYHYGNSDLVSSSTLYEYYPDHGGLNGEWWNPNNAIRPILTLKSGITASSGDGTSSSPWVLN